MKYKIYSASMTPINDDGTIDAVSFERMVSRNLAHGVSGFFLLGTMGEGLLQPPEMQTKTIATGCEVIGDKAEILVNVSDSGLTRTLANVKAYARYPFTHYVLQLPQNNIFFASDPVDYITTVADACDRPMYYYHVPPRNNFNLTIPQLKEIVQHPNIVGIKNSSGAMYLRRELLRLKQEGVTFNLFEGQEWSIDEALILGCDGALCGMVPLASKLMVNIAKAVDYGQLDQAMKLQNILINIFHGVYGESLTTIWIGQKYALHRLGILDSYHSLVQNQEQALTPERRAEIEQCLEEYGEYLD